jgi:RNA polymerase sigma factor (sigma-70 family)
MQPSAAAHARSRHQLLSTGLQSAGITSRLSVLPQRITMAKPEIDPVTVRFGLAGDPSAVRTLIEAMAPVVHARVVRALHRRHDARGRDLAQDVADFTQDVFVALFSEDGKALRSWDPQRGLSFQNFVGLLAQRRVASLLRVRKRNPWSDQTVRDSEPALLPALHEEPIEAGAASRELLGQLLTHLESTLSTRGLDLFQRLYVDEQTVAEVCKQTGLSSNAVHQWRRRLGLLARDALEKLRHQRDSDAGPNASVIDIGRGLQRSAK